MAPDVADPSELVPELSLVLTVRNRGDVLGGYLESTAEVLADTCQSWEIVTVDDGSSDESLDVIRRTAEDQPQFRVLMQPEPRGKARTLQRGFDAARHMVIATVDVGVELHRNFMLEAWAALRSTDVITGVWHPRRSLSERLAWSWACRSLSTSLGFAVDSDGRGPFMLRRSAAEMLKLTGPDSVVGLELLGRANRAGLRWREIPLISDPADPGSDPPAPSVLARAARQLRAELG